MNIQAFILSFKEAFGETTELPLFFLYWNTCESGRIYSMASSPSLYIPILNRTNEAIQPLYFDTHA